MAVVAPWAQNYPGIKGKREGLRMAVYPLRWSDIRVEVFRAGGKGGQHQNKTSSAVRLIHGPTNVRVECRNERCQHKNKAIAFQWLQDKLDTMLAEQAAAGRKAAHDAKPDAAFGQHVRTVRLCGNDQGVVDHRTGFRHPSAAAYLRGDIGGFLDASMRA